MVLSTPTKDSACDMTRRFLRLDYTLHPLEKTITGTNPNLPYPEYGISTMNSTVAHRGQTSIFTLIANSGSLHKFDNSCTARIFSLHDFQTILNANSYGAHIRAESGPQWELESLLKIKTTVRVCIQRASGRIVFRIQNRLEIMQ